MNESYTLYFGWTFVLKLTLSTGDRDSKWQQGAHSGEVEVTVTCLSFRMTHTEVFLTVFAALFWGGDIIKELIKFYCV